MQCTAYDCGPETDIIVHKDGKKLNGHYTPLDEASKGVVINCSSIVVMDDNGSSIYCYNQGDGSRSAKIKLLVQG